MNHESRSLYRSFYRTALFAVNYSSQSRPHVITRLNHLFRSPIAPSPEVVEKTKLFLLRAGQGRGIENKIVKNFCTVQFYRVNARALHGKDRALWDVIGDPYAHYDEALRKFCQQYGIHLI